MKVDSATGQASDLWPKNKRVQKATTEGGISCGGSNTYSSGHFYGGVNNSFMHVIHGVEDNVILRMKMVEERAEK